jgi:hypothetical protein
MPVQVVAPRPARARRRSARSARRSLIRKRCLPSGVLVHICCELKGLEEAEKANGCPQRAGKVVLQIALTRLAKQYGLITENNAARRGPASLGGGRLSADPRWVEAGGKPERRSGGLVHGGFGSFGIAPDALHHGHEAVRALRRQVLIEIELTERLVGVDA